MQVAESGSRAASARAAGRPSARPRSDEELSGLGGPGVEALFARHHTALYRFCSGLMGPGDEAADVMQIVWERAFITFSRPHRTVAKVRPWLYTVARHECLDAIRARDAKRVDVGDVEIAGGVNPEESFEQRAELELLLGDLAELSERQRSALVLRELAGFEGEQLAGALGTSPLRAARLIAAARRGLNERRSGRGMPCFAVQHELTRMRRRSRPVQAHLDNCASCQSFERGRRGRSLSSLAISPLLFAGGLAERVCALVPVAPQGLVVRTAATALVAGSIGLVRAESPPLRGQPDPAARPGISAEHDRAVPVRRLATAPDAHHSARAARRVRRQVAVRTPAPHPRLRSRAPARDLAPPASPPSPAGATAPGPAPEPADASPAPAQDPRPAVAPGLVAGLDETLARTLVTTQSVADGLHDAVERATALLRR